MDLMQFTLTAGPSAGQARPALVTSVNPDKTVNLTVFVEARDGLCPSGLMLLSGIDPKTAQAAIEPEPEPTGYEAMTVKELTALANERGLTLAGNARKADIIAALEAMDPVDGSAEEGDATDEVADEDEDDEPEA